jgi:ubiquinone/menaquinone biosynthesis C-methylase UbiE
MSSDPRTEAEAERAYYDENHRVYPKFARWYDAVVWPIRGLRSTVAVAAGIGPGMRVLDVATGTGEQAIAFGKRGAEVVGVDISAEMLRIARGKNRASNVRFSEADATQLPFAEASFDAACISFALHEMPAHVRARALHELTRVVKPGGTVIVVDYGLPRRAVAAAIVSSAVDLYEGATYLDFVHSDLPALLRASGLAIRETRRAVFGAVQFVIAARSRER